MADEKEGMNTEEQLMEKLLKNSEKQLFYSRIASLAVLVLAAVVIICLVMIVPKVMTTITNANEIMAQATETITLANTAIESVTEMSVAITDMGTDMDTFITENSKSIEEVMHNLEAIDFEGLNGAIEDLGDVVEPLANFFGKFK